MTDLKKLPCFRHVKWHPDRDELKRFAKAMLVGFFLLGLLAAWRHHHLGTTTFVLWTAGAALAAGGLTPGLGRTVYLLVYVPTSIIGYVVSHVLLALIYFFVFTPLGLILRATGKDFLQLRRSAGSRWLPRPAERRPESYYRQF